MFMVGEDAVTVLAAGLPEDARFKEEPHPLLVVSVSSYLTHAVVILRAIRLAEYGVRSSGCCPDHRSNSVSVGTDRDPSHGCECQP